MTVIGAYFNSLSGYYLYSHWASGCVFVYVCPPRHLYRISTALHISFGGEGHALYPVLTSYLILIVICKF